MSSEFTEMHSKLREAAMRAARESLHFSHIPFSEKLQRLRSLAAVGLTLEDYRMDYMWIPKFMDPTLQAISEHQQCSSSVCKEAQTLLPKELWSCLLQSIKKAQESESVYDEFAGYMGQIILEDAASAKRPYDELLHLAFKDLRDATEHLHSSSVLTYRWLVDEIREKYPPVQAGLEDWDRVVRNTSQPMSWDLPSR